MTFSNILFEKKNSIAYVTVNRPKVLNALNMATMEELRAAFHDIKNDAGVRVVILTGAGEKAFIAGADIGELAKHDAVSGKEYTHRGQSVLNLEMITAQEAHRIGLVNEVTAPGDLIPRAEAIAQKIIANAPLAVQYAMEAVNKGMEMTLAEGLYLEAALFGVSCATEDKKEGTTAFLEKRAAQFKGK